MSNEMAGVTPEQVERIAAIVAREVVGKLGKELREEIGQEVNDQLKTYFGDMTPAQHSIQHSNLDKLLNRLDTISSGFFGGIISKITSFLITALLLGFSRLRRQEWTAIKEIKDENSRGIRNNNPGNLDKGSPWQGLLATLPNHVSARSKILYGGFERWR